MLTTVVVFSVLLAQGFGQDARDDQVNLLVLGDWGGSPSPPYHLPAQVMAAEAMGKVGEALAVEAVVALGDNFYYDGVTSDTDKRFQKTWDEVYDAPSLQKPWYVIGGNHDYKGNITAQIDFTKLSNRWKFPSYYHNHSFTSKDKSVTVDLILLDTIKLCDTLTTHDEDDPNYFAPLAAVPRSYGEDQWNWLESQLAQSTADFVLVGGHFPVYSVCQHGNTQTLIDYLKPLLEQYGAHYMAGHDHCLEHLEENGVNYIVSGMADLCCYSHSHLDDVPDGILKWHASKENVKVPKLTAGFTSLSITSATMQINYHNQDGDVMFAADPVSPRKAQTKAKA